MRLGRLTVLVIVCAAVGLTACGRRGKLEPPPETATVAPVGAPVAGTVETKPDAEPLEERSFFLDWLID